MKINGLTWSQWATQLFEFENCDECGKGIKGHTKTVFLGNWFAKCKTVNVEKIALDKRAERLYPRSMRKMNREANGREV